MAKKERRILGPYEERAGWRVIEVSATGRRTSHTAATKQEAHRLAKKLVAGLRIELRLADLVPIYLEAKDVSTSTRRDCGATLQRYLGEHTGPEPDAKVR